MHKAPQEMTEQPAQRVPELQAPQELRVTMEPQDRQESRARQVSEQPEPRAHKVPQEMTESPELPAHKVRPALA